MAFRFPLAFLFTAFAVWGLPCAYAQDAGVEADDADDQQSRFAAKLRDDVVAEERLKAIDAILLEADDEPALILVDLLKQRAPRKPFEQLVDLIGGNDTYERYRRDEFIVPLALALAAGDADSASIRVALMRHRSGDLLAHARELLADDETQPVLAGIALVHLRPKGTKGVVSVIEALVEMLEHDQEEVSRRAYDALRAVTYLDLANDVVLWEKWLDRYDSEAERMNALADAAVRHLESLGEQNNKLQEALLVEILQQMEREKADDPQALVLRLESPYLRIREMAARMLTQLLPGIQDAQEVASIITALQTRLDPALHESAEVQLEIAKALAARPQEAFDSVDHALRRNHLPPAVKIELLKALKTPRALPLLAHLLVGADAKVVDPVHLQVIDQVKVCADANASEGLAMVYARFASLLGQADSEEGAQRQIVVAILDTLRYLVSLKSVSIEALLPPLRTMVERNYEERSTVFDLLTKAVQTDGATARLLKSDQNWAKTLEAVALAYPLEFDRSLVGDMRSLLDLYCVVEAVPDSVHRHAFSIYRNLWRISNQGDQEALRTLLSQALARFVVTHSQAPGQSLAEVLKGAKGFEMAKAVLEPLKVKRRLSLVLEAVRELGQDELLLTFRLLEYVNTTLPDDSEGVEERGQLRKEFTTLREEQRVKLVGFATERLELMASSDGLEREQVLIAMRELICAQSAVVLLPLFFAELEQTVQPLQNRRAIGSLVRDCLMVINAEAYADVELAMADVDEEAFDQAVASLRTRLEADQTIRLLSKNS